MKKKSILIIMKKDEYFQLLSEHLRVNNFDVIITENGKDGFETARNNLPDIIIVGRAIYNSKDVLLTVNQLNEKIN